MHETFMAQQVADALVRIAAEHNAARLTRAVLKVGPMRQAVPDLLRFALDVALADTPAAGAQIVIEPVPARCRCVMCKAEFEVAGWSFICPSCGSGDVTPLSGDELLIETVTLEDSGQ